MVLGNNLLITGVTSMPKVRDVEDPQARFRP